MANLLIAPQGTRLVTLTAGQSIALYSDTETQVFEVVGFPNYPFQLDDEVVFTGFRVLGPYAAGATLQVNAGAAGVQYAVGVAPVLTGIQTVQAAPATLNATGTLTAAMLAAGIVTSTTAAGVTATLDTGAVMETATVNMGANDAFDWYVVNTGPNTFTVTAAASGHTVVGAGAVATATSGHFRTRKTAVDTFITYRVS
jgi:hypothetical protein